MRWQFTGVLRVSLVHGAYHLRQLLFKERVIIGATKQAVLLKVRPSCAARWASH